MQPIGTAYTVYMTYTNAYAVAGAQSYPLVVGNTITQFVLSCPLDIPEQFDNIIRVVADVYSKAMIDTLLNELSWS
jgi:hypothetical protein